MGGGYGGGQGYGYGGGGGGGGGTLLLRRFRAAVGSPGTARRRGAEDPYGEDNILVQAGSGRKGRRRGGLGIVGPGSTSGASGRGGTGSAAAALLLLLLVVVGAVLGLLPSRQSMGEPPTPLLSSSSSSSSSSSPATSSLTFRPDPVPGSALDRAIRSYRSHRAPVVRDGDGGPSSPSSSTSSSTSSSPSSSWMAMDDPLHPGPVLVLLDLADDGEGEDDGRGLADPGGSHFRPLLDLAARMQEELEGGDWASTAPAPGADAASSSSSSSSSSGGAARFLVRSYHTVHRDGLPHVALAGYGTRDGRSVLMEVGYTVPPGEGERREEYGMAVAGTVRDYLRRGGTLPPGVTAVVTGLPLLAQDLRTAAAAAGEGRKKGGGLDLGTNLGPGSGALRAYRLLSERFGPGILSPYRIVFARTGGDDDEEEEEEEHDHRGRPRPVDTDPGFAAMHRVVSALAQEVDPAVETPEEVSEEERETLAGWAAVNLDSVPQRIEDGRMKEHLDEVMDELYGPAAGGRDKAGLGPRSPRPPARTQYNGISVLRNNQVPYPLYLGARICRERQHHHCDLELLHHFTELTDSLTSPDRTSTSVTATLGVDPFSADGVAWLVAARAKIAELEAAGSLSGYRVSILGGAALEYDALLAAGEREQQRRQHQGGAGSIPAPARTARYLIGSAAAVLGAAALLALARRSTGRAFDLKRN